MAFATADFTHTQAEKEKKQGFFSRAVNAMIDARMRQAERQVATQLLAMDDRTLSALGYERSELQTKRNNSRY